MKVVYAGYIRQSVVHGIERDPKGFYAILTSFEPAPPGDGPGWQLVAKIGEGPSARIVDIQLSPIVSQAEYQKSFSAPVLIAKGINSPEALALFRDRLFKIEHQQPRSVPLNDGERQEVVLRVKKLVYSEEEEINSIKSYVANVEAARNSRRAARAAIRSPLMLSCWCGAATAAHACPAAARRSSTTIT